MAKDGVVSIAIDYKNELNQMIRDYESALTEMASSDKLSKGMKAQFDNTIAELKRFKADMEKSFSELSVGKVDKNSFKAFKQTVNKNFESVRAEIDNLNLAVSTINSQIKILGGDLDISKISSQFKDFQDYVQNINNAIDTMIKKLDGQGVSLMTFDDSAVNQAKSQIKEINKLLKSTDEFSDAKGSKYELFDTDQAQAELDVLARDLKNTLELIEKSESELSNFDKNSIGFEKTISQINILKLKAADLYDSIQQLMDIPDKTGEYTFGDSILISDDNVDKKVSEYGKIVKGTLDEIRESAIKTREELERIVTPTSSKAASAKMSDKLNPNSAELVTGVTIETASSELWKKLSPILEDLQNVLNKNPVVAPVKLVVAPNAVSSEKNGEAGTISKSYSKKYQRELAKTGEDAVIDLEGVYKKTFTSIMDEAVSYSKETISKIQNIFESSPIKLHFDFNEEEFKNLSDALLSSDSGKKIDITGQIAESKKEVNELAEKLAEVNELLNSSDSKDFSFKGFDKFAEEISKSLGQLTELQSMLKALQNIESTLARASGVSSVTDIETQWQNVSKLIENSIKLDGTFRKNVNIDKLATEYNKYLNMGGTNELSSIGKIEKLEDNKNIIDVILSKVKELNSQKVDTSSVDKADNKLKSVSSTLDDVISRLDHMINLTRDIGNTFWKMFKDASVSDVDKQWSSIESKFKSIADESGKINLSKQKKDIQELVEMYQKYANAGGMKTPFDLTDNIETIKKMNKVYEQMNSKKDGTSSGSESKEFSKVEGSVNSLTSAINTKTESIKTEANTMELAARAEVKSIQKIIDALNPLIEKIKNIPELKIPKGDTTIPSKESNIPSGSNKDNLSDLQKQEKIYIRMANNSNLIGKTSSEIKQILKQEDINGDSVNKDLKDRVLLLEKGRVIEELSADNYKELYYTESLIGKSKQEVLSFLQKENAEVAEGNKLYRERMIYFKDGKVVQENIGDSFHVKDKYNRSNEADELLHTHPEGKLNQLFSIEDIISFMDEFSSGVKIFSVLSGNKLSKFDLSGLNFNSYSDFIDQYINLFQSVESQFKNFSDKGAVPQDKFDTVVNNFQRIISQYITKTYNELEASVEYFKVDGSGNILSSMPLPLKNSLRDAILEVSKFLNSLMEKVNQGELSIEDAEKQLDEFTVKKFNKKSTASIDQTKDAFPDSSTETKPETEGMEQVEKATEEAIQAKKDFATANEGVQSSIDGSENPLKLEAELMEQIAKSAREAADAKKEFVEANKQVKDSADGSTSNMSKEDVEKRKVAYKELLDAIKRYSKVYGRVARDKGLDGDIDEMQRLEDKILRLQKEPILSSAQIQESERQLTLLFDKIDDIEKQVKKTNQQKTENSLLKIQDNATEKLSKYTNSSKYTPEFIERVNSKIEEVRQLDITKPKDVARLKEIDGEIQKIVDDSKLLENRLVKQDSKIADIISQMKIFAAQNTNMSSAQKQALNDNIKYAEELSNSGTTNAQAIEKIKSSFAELRAEVNTTGRAGKNFLGQIKNRLTDINSKFIAQFLSWQDWIKYLKQAAQIVTQINTNIVELAKVSEQSSKQIYKDFNSYADIAKNMGSTISDTISATADWSRNGYTIPDAKKLAEVALLYKNVGDGIDINEANESLISTLRGFKLEADQAEHIVDVFNEVSNNEAISSSGIGEALQRSAASFNAANTSLEKSVALVTATNSVIQDPDKVGNMWKTVSARIRGAKSELAEMGEDTDDMVESTSKLRDLVKGITGFDIMKDENTFKDIYDIVIGISEKWDTLSDIDQASLLENLAGKNQSNALAAALSNVDLLKKSYEEATNAEGSAREEQEEYTKGIQYSIDKAKASLEELANDFLSSDFLKGLIDAGEKIITFLDKIIDRFGVLPSLITPIVAILSAKNKNFGKLARVRQFQYHCRIVLKMPTLLKINNQE